MICGKTRDKQHEWDGCKCTKCGLTRNERHNWDNCKCLRCGRIDDDRHEWNGCTCVNCGKKRDEAHSYEQINKQCVEKCKICGKTRKTEHKYETVPGNCVSRCSVCGSEQVNHTMKLDESDKNSAVCVVCGYKSNNKEHNKNLMRAVEKKESAAIIKLIKLGADPNYENGNGDTPLTAALKHEEYNGEILDLLIDNGADVNYRNAKAVTPLISLFLNKRVNEDDARQKAMSAAMSQFNSGSSMIHVSFKVGGDSNKVDETKHLIGRGADTNVEYNGLSVAQLAKNNDYREAASLLK